MMCDTKQTILFCSYSLPTVVLSLCAALMLAFYSQATFARELASPAETETVVAVVPALFPPQYQLNGLGNPEGFAIEIMDEVASRADLRIFYRVEKKWPDVFEALRSGQADLIPNLGVSEKRKKDFIYSHPVETIAIGIIVRKATNDIHSLEDLFGRRVATVQGNISVSLLSKHPEINLQVEGDVEDTLFALLSSDVDAIVYPLPWVNRMARRAGLDHKIKTVGEPLHEVKRAIAVRKSDIALLARIDDAVKSLVNTEQYRQIYQKWYGQTKPYWTGKRVSWAVFGTVVAIVIIMAIWHYFSVLSVNRKLSKSLEQRKLARDSLRENERQLQGLMYHSNAIIFIKDLEGRYLMVNRRFNEIAGLGRESGVGKTDFDLFSKETADALYTVDTNVIVSRRVRETEEAIAGKVYLFVKYCLYDEDGEAYALGGMATDISKRVFAEDRMRSSEQRYRQLVESLSDEYFFYSQNLDGEYTYLSPSINTILGYGEDEFETQWRQYLTDNAINVQAQDLENNILSCEYVPTYELEILNKGKQKRRLEIFSTATKNDDGEIIGFEGIVHDITSRTESEKKLQRQEYELRQILDNMIDGVIGIDESGKINRFNRSAEKMFGYSAEQIIGNNVDTLMTEDDQEAHNYKLKRYTGVGKSKIIGATQQVTAKHHNGKTFPIQLSVAELPKENDGKRRFIGSCVDVTTQQQQEDQLRHSSKMDALGKLTGGVAHDYNNMLGVILGYCEMLEDSMEDKHLLKYVSEIHRAGERGAKLTRRLLSFSRRKSAEADNVDINELLDDIQLMLEKSIMSRIELRYDLEIGLWPVWLDQGDLEDAVLNISINAMHAIDKEGVLTINTSNVTLSNGEAKNLGLRSGDYVKLSLSDTGKGMDEETCRKVFDPFFTTKGDKGTGLGLSQVYGFVQQAEGTIDVQSTVNVGTNFSIYFPRNIVGNSFSGNDEAPRIFVDNERSTILVVDDDESLREITVETLRNNGFHVLSADGGEMALDILNGKNVDVVLSDVRMPGMDGYQLASKISSQFPGIKVQLMSGYDAKENLSSSGEDLKSNLLHKPFRTEDLILRLDTVLAEIENKV